MTDPRKEIFDAIRKARDNHGFKDLEIKKIDTLLDELGVAKIGDRDAYEHLLSVAANRPADATIKAMAQALKSQADFYGQNKTKQRLAEFIAQLSVESQGFTRFEENLNYRAERLTQVWPGRFPSLAAAQPYAHNPEKLANKTYGGRMGNTQVGDGWKYRGRGGLQLTGRDNYARYGTLCGLPLVDKPELAADPATSVHIALEFFKQAKVNEAVDRGDFREARRRVNGGHHGLSDVATIRAKVLGAMS